MVKAFLPLKVSKWSLLYNFHQTEDGSYRFITRHGFDYLVYFSESIFPDAEGNTHTTYSLGFTRNGKHNNTAFVNRHDPSVKATIMFIVNDFLKEMIIELWYFSVLQMIDIPAIEISFLNVGAKSWMNP